MSKSVITEFEARFEAESKSKVKGVMKVGNMVIDGITDERLSVENFHVEVSDGEGKVKFKVYSDKSYKQSDHRALVRDTISRIMEQRSDSTDVEYTIEVVDDESEGEGDGE